MPSIEETIIRSSMINLIYGNNHNLYIAVDTSKFSSKHCKIMATYMQFDKPLRMLHRKKLKVSENFSLCTDWLNINSDTCTSWRTAHSLETKSSFQNLGIWLLMFSSQESDDFETVIFMILVIQHQFLYFLQHDFDNDIKIWLDITFWKSSGCLNLKPSQTIQEN